MIPTTCKVLIVSSFAGITGDEHEFYDALSLFQCLTSGFLVVPSDEASLLVGYNIILKTESFQHSSFI
jgi:hypothetical protein